MATAKPSVSVETNDAGDYVLGATIGKVFVPFVTRSAAHVDRYIAKASGADEKSTDDESEEG